MGTIIERKGKKGISYRAQIRRHGKFLRNQKDSLSKTFKTYREANEWIKKMESEIREQEPQPFLSQQNTPPHDITLAMLCTLYERQVQQYKADSTRLTERHLVQWWKDHLGAVPIRMIQPFLINEHILLLMQDKQNPTVKKYMNVLSSILKFAVEQGIIERNPITTMRKPKILKPKVRFLDDEERKKLLQTAKTDMNPRMYPALVLSLLKNDTRGE